MRNKRNLNMTGNFTMRMDKESEKILSKLAISLSDDKSKVIRRSLRVLNDFLSIQRNHGELIFTNKQGDQFIYLLI